VNGQYVLAVSELENVKGLSVIPMDEATSEPAFESHFAKYADKSDNIMVALNTAAFTNGVFIHLKKGVVLDKPIQIIHVATGKEDFFAQTRNLIVVEPNAELELIESFITAEGTANNVHNKVSEIIVKENAKVQHYYLQLAESVSRYFNHTEVYQEKDSLYNNYNCNFPGASFIRNNINVRLDAAHVESHLYGINLTAGDQLVDNHTIVDHLKPHCESYEWYKNITQDKSVAVFNGKIFVREDAQKQMLFSRTIIC
jgi:Fe-S cluster assembly protein SufD